MINDKIICSEDIIELMQEIEKLEQKIVEIDIENQILQQEINKALVKIV